ncbi:heavy-metal-associated domain-containing protein [Caballeronia sp. LZ062]|uniref:heavy-metal-associated domain-containing protein n=1 Tax=unclassified Caballeronia TaxID=2646786 RepID=UPI002862EC30|nr:MULTISPECIES: heavy-metal-associated domain-containing protein [unclassified Caballeronia]MDR5855725.1 heavy-metal-associated domain-containing protein [Caballeronia sp. LZ050]MDR5872488.1 heavy-metal-associated domain-containing protein [Caballeronia sp. LZ062]
MEFKVNDMSCGGCANSITRAVTTADPAAKLEVDIASKTVKISSVLTSERLVAVIEAAGYHPTVNA